MPNDFNIVVLISGRGSNFLSLIEHARNYRISAVITDNPQAAGLEFAKKSGITAVVVAKSGYETIAQYRHALAEKVGAFSPNLVALAGFMQLVKPPLLTQFANRIINIHPALLPKFPGLDTHKRALEAGANEHGCTVHVVDAGMDTGPIIVQAKCKVEGGDSESILAERVLKLEHKLYPWIINSIANGDITILQGLVKFSAKARSEAKDLNFMLP